MTTPFWCLMIGLILPYVWAGASLPFRSRQFEGGKESRLGSAEADVGKTKLEGPGVSAMPLLKARRNLPKQALDQGVVLKHAVRLPPVCKRVLFAQLNQGLRHHTPRPRPARRRLNLIVLQQTADEIPRHRIPVSPGPP